MRRLLLFASLLSTAALAQSTKQCTAADVTGCVAGHTPVLQTSPIIWKVTPGVYNQAATPAQFTNCTITNSSGNLPNYQDMSEVYTCDQGQIELHGRWTYRVEYGQKYHFELGRIDSTTEKATLFDRDLFKWCKLNSLEVEVCGFSKAAADIKLDAVPWYPNPNEYPEKANK